MPFLQDAANITVTGGYFTDVGGDHYTIQGDLAVNSESEKGISILEAASALGATHDSYERYPPPKCHPGTRRTALQAIDSWMEDMVKKCRYLASVPSSAPGSSGKTITHGRILWLHGPAGAGKSAVAQTVSEIYIDRNQLVGSFFFSRGVPRRDTIRHLFPTIAYQIAMRIPGMRSRICSAVESDPSIFAKSPESQIHHLIVLPFQSLILSENPSQAPFLLILDGLDECGNQDVQCNILRHAADLLYKHGLPLCFLIVSRPESHIKRVLRSNTFCSYGTAEEVSLYADSNFVETQDDVRAFLLGEFDRIYHSENHQDFMKFISKPWPSIDIIDCLVERSGGYFIYVATVIRFVDEEFSYPVAKLELVLDASESSLDGSPFAELDNLYRQILSIHPKRDLLLRILGFIFVPLPLQKYQIGSHYGRKPDVIERVLSLPRGTVRSTLSGMHSLLRMEGAVIESFHASFQDFLIDKGRAGNSFFIEPEQHHGDMALNLLKIVDRYQDESTSSDEREIFLSWPFHAFEASDTVKLDIFAKINSINIERWVPVVASLNPYQPVVIYMFYLAVTWLQDFGALAQDLIDQVASLLDLSFKTAVTDLEMDPVIVQGVFNLFPFFGPDFYEPPFARDIKVFEDWLGYSTFKDFVNDVERSEGSFAPPAVCHAHLALSCMHLLGHRKILHVSDGRRSLGGDFPMYPHGTTPSIDTKTYQWHRFFTECKLNAIIKSGMLSNQHKPGSERVNYSRQHWANHLSLSSPGEASILHCLRVVGKHIIRQTGPCKSSMTAAGNAITRSVKHETDLANAALVVEWLKRMPKPPSDLLRVFTPCWRCGKFHALGNQPRLIVPGGGRPTWRDLITISAELANCRVDDVYGGTYTDYLWPGRSSPRELLIAIRSNDDEALGWTGRMWRKSRCFVKEVWYVSQIG